MNQQQPKISVIIPVYNTEDYLRECLDGVVCQTLRDIEIICVDDGSTDGSLAILREYEKKDNRIKVLTQSNINAGAARNHGLRHATGEYLSFLDADDRFEPDMLEKSYAAAKEKRAEVCVYCFDFFNEEGKSCGKISFFTGNLPENRPFAGTEVKKDLFGTFVGWAWDKLFLREFIEQNQIAFQEQRTTNDLFFTFYSLAIAQKITVIEDVLIHHRTHIQSSLEATRAQSWDCFYKGLCALRDALKNAGVYEYYERAFVNYSLNFSLWNLFTIPWPIQELLYYNLKLIWFRDLGLTDRDESYFFDKNEYELLVKILEKPYYDESPEALKQRIDEQEARIAEQERHAAEQDWRISDLENSVSYRVGRGVTWLPRKIRGGIRRIIH